MKLIKKVAKIGPVPSDIGIAEQDRLDCLTSWTKLIWSRLLRERGWVSRKNIK
jgi:hypothetical protein